MGEALTDRGRWIWLDDRRLAPVGWEGSRTAAECIALLARGDVDVVDLDHDLVEKHYGPFDPEALGTGYDVTLWLERQAYDGRWDLVPKDLRCHSLSEKGRKRILASFGTVERLRTEAGR
jgi:hypothetical protein